MIRSGNDPAPDTGRSRIQRFVGNITRGEIREKDRSFRTDFSNGSRLSWLKLSTFGKGRLKRKFRGTRLSFLRKSLYNSSPLRETASSKVTTLGESWTKIQLWQLWINLLDRIYIGNEYINFATKFESEKEKEENKRERDIFRGEIFFGNIWSESWRVKSAER